jgi:diguanylate cyclase (GGDEF)-like protein/PAS domain S-box-containing protein
MNTSTTLETPVRKKRRFNQGITMIMALYFLASGITGFSMYHQKINDDNQRLSLLANQLNVLTKGFYSSYISKFQMLSHLDAVQTKETRSLNILFKKLNSQFREFENVAIVDENGFFFGSGQPFDTDSPPNISKLPFFKALAGGEQVVIMPPHKGPISGQLVTGVVIRLEDNAGNFKGILGTSIKFSKLRSLWDNFSRKNNTTYFYFGPKKEVTYAEGLKTLDLDLFFNRKPDYLSNDRNAYFYKQIPLPQLQLNLVLMQENNTSIIKDFIFNPVNFSLSVLTLLVIGFLTFIRFKEVSWLQLILQNDALLNATQKITKTGGWEWDTQNKTMMWTREMFHIHDLPQVDGNLNSSFLEELRECYSPESYTRIIEAVNHCIENGRPYDMELLLKTKSNKKKWIRSTAEAITDEKGVNKVVGVVKDISMRKRAEKQLLLTDNVFTNTIEGIIITDEKGIIHKVNTAFSRITGFPEKDALGKTPSILKSDHQDKAFYREMWKDLIEKGQWSGEIWNRKKDGGLYPIWLSITAIRDRFGTVSNYVGLFHDITEKKSQEEKLKHLAFHDPLTRLPNRKLFYDRISVAIQSAMRNQCKMALLYIDIDNFKNINDSFGHPFGDEFLCGVKDRILGICRESDTFARYGGDEFVIVLNQISTSSEAVSFADRVVDLFSTPLRVMEEEVYSSLSIGLAMYPDNGRDVVTLEKNADMALYKAKKEGKQRAFLFKSRLKEKMERNALLENELRRSLEDFSTFDIRYQPKIDISTQQIYGVEALIRWSPPGINTHPGEFIPLAEKTQMIILLGRWLMEKAMIDIKGLHDKGFDHLRLSINLSFKQFCDTSLFPQIEDILARTGFDRSKLCFEITESTPMKDVEGAVAIMEGFNARGISLSMDDFGTGYSSLAHLKRFPLKEMKIDKTFVRDLPEDPNDAAICQTIIQMARTMNLDVVAEGVETEEQLAFFKKYHCPFIQGFFFFKPMPIQELAMVMAQPDS